MAQVTLFLSIVFGIFSVVSVPLTVYYGRKYRQAEMFSKTIDWPDLRAAANDLAEQVTRTFTPQVIFAPGPRGATFANLLYSELRCRPLIYVGISYWKDDSPLPKELPGFETIGTRRWILYVPQSLLALKDKTILIVDAYVSTGDCISEIHSLLLKNGFSENAVRTMSVVATNVAIQSGNAPDYFWRQQADSSFYFPWGKAQ